MTNFVGDELERVKMMIKIIGAKLTRYMTRSNSVLICKRYGSQFHLKLHTFCLYIIILFAYNTLNNILKKQEYIQWN